MASSIMTPARLRAPGIVLAALLAAPADCHLDTDSTPPPPVRAAADASPSPTGKPHTSRMPRRQTEIIGRGWTRKCRRGDPLADDCDLVTTYQLELPTGPRTSRDITVSKAVYEACGLGELYDECAEG
jgi:hypothetical protein